MRCTVCNSDAVLPAASLCGDCQLAAVRGEQPQRQTYRLEIRWDFTGTETEAKNEAARVAGLVDGEVTAVFDESWEEV